MGPAASAPCKRTTVLAVLSAMQPRLTRTRRSLVVWVLLSAMIQATATLAQSGYRPIAPKGAGEVMVLTVHDLTIDQVVAIARDGAKVTLIPDAKQRQSDAYGLLLEASAE